MKIELTLGKKYGLDPEAVTIDQGVPGRVEGVSELGLHARAVDARLGEDTREHRELSHRSLRSTWSLRRPWWAMIPKLHIWSFFETILRASVVDLNLGMT